MEIMWLENEIIFKNKNEIGRPHHDKLRLFVIIYIFL